MIGFLLALVLVYLGAIVGAAWLAVRPRRLPHVLHPAQTGTDSIRIDVPGEVGDLKSWWIAPPEPVGVIVFAHGYYLNRSEWVVEAARFRAKGYACLLFDFRAFGSSPGTVTSVGYRERADVISCVEWVRANVPPGTPVGGWGSSMGAAALAFAAGERPELFDFVVLDSCYGRLDRSVGGWWRFVGGPVLSILLAPVMPIAAMLAEFDPRKADVPAFLPRYDGPILILHGEEDDLARPDEVRRILEAVPQAEVKWFPGSAHSAARWEHPEEYVRVAEEFVDRAVAARRS